MDLKKYILELKRRHVVKSAIAYLVVAWLIIQVLSIIIPTFAFSTGLMKTGIIILIIAFPIWIIISWIYDFTPSGFKKTKKKTSDPELSVRNNVNLNRVIIGGLSIAIILLIVNQVRLKNKMDNGVIAMASINFKSSIAVLALKDMSPNQDQEYFSDGISDALINKLAKYRDLKVIDRKSSFFFKNKNVKIEVIGNDLDVAYVLLGSVKKSGKRFKITVQLVEVKDGSLVWSEDYDSNMEDAIFVQDSIAIIVANKLQITLLNEDVRSRKVDPEAYELYLKAEIATENISDSTIHVANTFINKSLEIDDTYAPAWAVLSKTIFWKTYYYVKQDNQGGAVSGMQAARKAIELDPGHSLGYLWLSNYQWRMREVKGFQENLKKALQTGPNQSSTIYFAGWSALKTNKLESAYEFFKKAKILGPKNWELYFDLGRLDLYFEKYDEAILNVNIYINNTSNKYGIYDVLAQIYLNKGNYKEALEAIEKEPIEYYRWWTKSHILYKMNKKEESEQLLNRLKNEEFSIADHANYTESALNLCIASIYVYRGNKNKAFDYLDNSLDYIYEYSDWFFPLPEFKILYDDPRWNILLDKIENEFNYDLSPN